MHAHISPLITMPWLGTSLNWHDSTMALLTSLEWAMSLPHTHICFPTHCAHFTHADAISPPHYWGPPLSLRKTPSRNPANRRPPIHHKPEQSEGETERERLQENKHCCNISWWRGAEGRGKDEGRMGGPWCKHRPTEHSPTCGVN